MQHSGDRDGMELQACATSLRCVPSVPKEATPFPPACSYMDAKQMSPLAKYDSTQQAEGLVSIPGNKLNTQSFAFASGEPWAPCAAQP